MTLAPSFPQNSSSTLFPETIPVEGILVDGFETVEALFGRVAHEVRRPGQAVIAYLNVHVANTAFTEPRLRGFLQEADVVYCDGAGIQLAARLLGQVLPRRLSAADWFIDLFRFLARENIRVFVLGGEPGIPDRMKRLLDEQVPGHTLVGCHHGYILNDKPLETSVTETFVIGQINALRPDLLIVGFGTPLQETWVDDHRHELAVEALWPLGAVMDYPTGKVSRCPAWMAEAGVEWLYRLCQEPRRLFARYVVGNPWFFVRILWARIVLSPIVPIRRPSPPSRPLRPLAQQNPVPAEFAEENQGVPVPV